MLDIQIEAAKRAIKMLDAAQVKYAVILPDGIHGPIKLKIKPSYKRGETRAYYWPLMENMKAGDIVEIPCKEYDLQTLAKNISATCVHAWGKGSAITQSNKEHNLVVVMRVL